MEVGVHVAGQERTPREVTHLTLAYVIQISLVRQFPVEKEIVIILTSVSAIVDFFPPGFTWSEYF